MCASFMTFLAIAISLAIPKTNGYTLVLDTNRLVGVDRPQGVSVGHLDKYGEYTHSFWEKKTLGFSKEVYRVVTPGTVDLVPVYEFRSGVLIPGAMNATGRFVPQVGGTIIRFADFIYTPRSPVIWNLPGYFRENETIPVKP